MKRIYILFFLLLFAGFSFAQNYQDTLTNEKIIQLSKIGLQPSVIISKIHSSITYFDVSTDALIKLNNNSVSPEVINEMMKINNDQRNLKISQIESKNPNAKHAPGIYYYNSENQDKPVKRVDPTVVSSSGAHGYSYYGIGGAKSTSSLSERYSKNQIKESEPTFYFYFETNSEPSASNWWFATATSPNEFALIKLIEKKNSRLFETGSVNTGGGFGGSQTGVPEKFRIPFEYEEVSEGIYKVTFKTPLKPGEYCFLYASSAPDRYTNNKVFDFGIPKTTK